MAETLGDRIRQVRGDLSQDEFSSRLAVHKETLGKYERDKRVPDADFLAQLRGKFGISIDWLVTGYGEMHVGQPPQPPAGAPGSRDPDLYGRVLEAISAVYKELGWGISLRQIGAEAAQIADDIAAEGLAPEDKPPAVKAAAVMLRRQLRAAAVDPTAEASTKDRA
ncbi:MAG: helix-turn-helix domain-containing protein [Magnetospirillum sp.]|nr:helix-turn-helix domain-containing protein [Magnetospirillum sp.]